MEYCEKFCVNKFNNLGKIDKFLAKYKSIKMDSRKSRKSK